MAPNFLALATTLENLGGARWLLAKKVNFVPCHGAVDFVENLGAFCWKTPNLNEPIRIQRLFFLYYFAHV